MDIKSITHLFHAREKGAFEPDLFPEASEQAEDFLIDMAHSDTHGSEALRCLLGTRKSPGQSEQYFTKLLTFMVATTFANPTDNTHILIELYRGFMLTHRWNILDCLKGFAEHGIGSKLNLIKSLEGDDLRFALSLFSYPITGTIHECIAHDDLKAFESVITIAPNASEWMQKYGYLSEFPLDPESRIHKHLIETDQDLKNLFLSRITHLRQDVGQEAESRLAHERFEKTHGESIHATWGAYYSPVRADLGARLYLADGFAESLRKDAFRCTKEFFGPTLGLRVAGVDGLNHIIAITQAFIESGLSPGFILTYGMGGAAEGSPLYSIGQVLDKLGQLKDANLDFYTPVCQAYFKDFDKKTLSEHCRNDDACLALYRMTRDKTFLSKAGSRVRDEALASDLGL
ncbi:hypothetical protein [Pseudomonas amygdali]|uniref:Uncharacterized protein n=2 Tax=Pseudomonas amygdali pv. lachrymans TaxID=53707 RepID=A0ABR5KQS0_PSEAV|nr:hypothetical protein [Pseudomonas amygdali]AXH59578.1 hypothetical protein PLA107_030600 [Pseudomonas amygdali pv. lachrymans str. M301315]KPC17004.1 Uncharacterized protein AC499_0206 [Pseudomonas amygdali pv. lachrymans]KPC17963.1 Uncharacterized protein AC499_1165 [Pseudomonas amygdali pv. lachrymans]RMT05736.1 hypothetical protein ALP54_03499 [Pseudomonas amygdali pv. lachrymans]